MALNSNLAAFFGLGFVSISLLAAEPSTGQAIARAVRPFVVVDSAGKLMGRLYGESRVQLTISGSAYVVDLAQYTTTQDGYKIPTTKAIFQPNWTVYFANGDCSGQAYIPGVAAPYLPAPGVSAPPLGVVPAVVVSNTDGGKTAYVATGPASSTNMFSGYRRSYDNGVCNFLADTMGNPTPAAAALTYPAKAVDITDAFAEPFSVQ